jgi:sarcosine oxidase subunit gamma
MVASKRPSIRRSALAERLPVRGKITLIERQGLGKVILRGPPEDPVFTAAAASLLGVNLPLAANTTQGLPNGGRAFWLGPNEWIIHVLSGGADLARKLDAGLAHCFHQAVDVTDQYTVIRLAGPRARGILAQACPLDFHPAAFAVGSVAQSRYAKAPVLFYLADAQPVFDLQVRWSYADYLWDYLLAAAGPVDNNIITPVA